MNDVSLILLVCASMLSTHVCSAFAGDVGAREIQLPGAGIARLEKSQVLQRGAGVIERRPDGGRVQPDTLKTTLRLVVRKEGDDQGRTVWSVSESHWVPPGSEVPEPIVFDMCTFADGVALFYQHEGKARVDFVSVSPEATAKPLWSAELFPVSGFRNVQRGWVHAVGPRLYVLVDAEQTELWEVAQGTSKLVWRRAE